VNETIVGIGELLWDLFPDGRCPGGAPFNFAWHARMLGADAVMISRLGEDRLGRDLREVVRHAGFDDRLIQHDPEHATGTVRVELKAAGQPSYTITEDVAWDFIEPQEAACAAVRQAAVLCFGSLAQRSRVSAEAITALIGCATRTAKIIFDVNLRQRFYTPETLERSLRAAHVVKLNDEELRTVGHMLSLGDAPAAEILRRYEIDLLVETLGADGCIVHRPDGNFRGPGFTVKVADTVGAGDAFTAALAVGLARGERIETMARQANLVGAFVASRRGGTPHYTNEDLNALARQGGCP
jgi:fructokinase